MARQENRLQQREDTLDHKNSLLDEREAGLTEKEDQSKQQNASLKAKLDEADELVGIRRQKLYDVAKLDKDQAKKIVLDQLSDELVKERAEMIRNSNARGYG